MSGFHRCDTCGRFTRLSPGVAWKMIYSYSEGVLMPDHEIYRCLRCVGDLGQFTPQQGIQQSASCGVLP